MSDQSKTRRRVFISHGHDETIKLKLRNFIKEHLDLEPVILGEQRDDGLTIIEKLERYGRDCAFAFILLTADDSTASGGSRARQNVIHELGYFQGRLGRKRVLLLKERGVELFSNISGLIFKEFPPGAIESVFEDIRLALKSGDLSTHADSIPLKADVSKVEWDRDAYWKVQEDGSKDGPFCQVCYDSSKNLCRLYDGSEPDPDYTWFTHSYLRCRVCSSVFENHDVDVEP